MELDRQTLEIVGGIIKILHKEIEERWEEISAQIRKLHEKANQMKSDFEGIEKIPLNLLRMPDGGVLMESVGAGETLSIFAHCRNIYTKIDMLPGHYLIWTNKESPTERVNKDNLFSYTPSAVTEIILHLISKLSILIEEKVVFPRDIIKSYVSLVEPAFDDILNSISELRKFLDKMFCDAEVAREETKTKTISKIIEIYNNKRDIFNKEIKSLEKELTQALQDRIKIEEELISLSSIADTTLEPENATPIIKIPTSEKERLEEQEKKLEEQREKLEEQREKLKKYKNLAKSLDQIEGGIKKIRDLLVGKKELLVQLEIMVHKQGDCMDCIENMRRAIAGAQEEANLDSSLKTPDALRENLKINTPDALRENLKINIELLSMQIEVLDSIVEIKGHIRTITGYKIKIKELKEMSSIDSVDECICQQSCMIAKLFKKLKQQLENFNNNIKEHSRNLSESNKEYWEGQIKPYSEKEKEIKKDAGDFLEGGIPGSKNLNNITKEFKSCGLLAEEQKPQETAKKSKKSRQKARKKLVEASTEPIEVKEGEQIVISSLGASTEPIEVKEEERDQIVVPSSNEGEENNDVNELAQEVQFVQIEDSAQIQGKHCENERDSGNGKTTGVNKPLVKDFREANKEFKRVNKAKGGSKENEVMQFPQSQGTKNPEQELTQVDAQCIRVSARSL